MHWFDILTAVAITLALLDVGKLVLFVIEVFSNELHPIHAALLRWWSCRGRPDGS